MDEEAAGGAQMESFDQHIFQDGTEDQRVAAVESGDVDLKKEDSLSDVDEAERGRASSPQHQDDLSSLGTHSVVHDAKQRLKKGHMMIVMRDPPTSMNHRTKQRTFSNSSNSQGGRLLDPPDAEDDDADSPDPLKDLNLPSSLLPSGKRSQSNSPTAPPKEVISSRRRFDIHDSEPWDEAGDDDYRENASVLSSVGAHSVVSDYRRVVLAERGMHFHHQQHQQAVKAPPAKPPTPETTPSSKDVDDKHVEEHTYKKGDMEDMPRCSTTAKVALIIGAVLCALAVALLAVYLSSTGGDDDENGDESVATDSIGDDGFWKVYLNQTKSVAAAATAP